MNLSTKFNLFLFFIFAFCLVIGGFFAHRLTEDNALQQITDQAELIMQEALAVRSYTVNEIRPLLNQLDDGQFHPQTVPAYSATQVANLVRKKRPNYFYKEAVFNPTNPSNKASPKEVEIINRLLYSPDLKRLTGDIRINQQKSLYIAFPIKITNPKCLACHGKPKNAPAAMRAIYGDKGGFGWHLNEIVGAQMVVVPYKLPAELARKTFYSFMVALTILFVILFIALNIMIRKMVLKPVKVMTYLADDLSKGNISGDEVKISGKDEIADLSRSFNRMRRSVTKIIQILRKDDAKNRLSGK